MAYDCHRIGDPNTAPANIINSAQTIGTVYANNILISVNNSIVAGHGIGAHAAPLTANGSNDVFAENIPINFQGNLDTCGHSRDSGSPNVYINAPKAIAAYESSYDITDPVSDPNVQPNITEVEAGIHLFDDPNDDDGLAIFPPAAIITSPTPIEEAQSRSNGWDTNTPEAISIEDDQTIPPPLTDIPANCSDIFSHVPPFLGTFPLSTNYNLEDLTTNTAISNYALQAQASLTEAQIVCNLRHVAENILEPILAVYPTMFITSGFRHGSGSSQHHKGEAVDIQFSGFSFQNYWDTSKIVRDTITYDQFILELGKTYWFHLSFELGLNSQSVLTRTKPGTYKPGLIRLV